VPGSDPRRRAQGGLDPTELVIDLHCRGRTLLAVLRDQPKTEVFEGGRYIRSQLRRRLDGVGEVPRDDGDGRVSGEWQLTSDELVDDDPERVEVTARVQHFATGLFRCKK